MSAAGHSTPQPFPLGVRQPHERVALRKPGARQDLNSSVKVRMGLASGGRHLPKGDLRMLPGGHEQFVGRMDRNRADRSGELQSGAKLFAGGQ